MPLQGSQWTKRFSFTLWFWTMKPLVIITRLSNFLRNQFGFKPGDWHEPNYCTWSTRLFGRPGNFWTTIHPSDVPFSSASCSPSNGCSEKLPDKIGNSKHLDLILSSFWNIKFYLFLNKRKFTQNGTERHNFNLFVDFHRDQNLLLETLCHRIHKIGWDRTRQGDWDRFQFHTRALDNLVAVLSEINQ